jgi:hypothetical protein
MFKMFNKDLVPTFGYILEKWDQVGYRSTAYAYLKRENLSIVKNRNGKTYTIYQIENAIIK